MRCFIIFIGFFVICSANKTETKEKRQIHETQIHQLSGVGGGAQPRQYVAKQSPHQSQHSSNHQASPNEYDQLSPEYYEYIRQLAIKQAEEIQNQQLEFATQKIIEQAGGGHVQVIPYTLPNAAEILQQQSQHEGAQSQKSSHHIPQALRSQQPQQQQQQQHAQQYHHQNQQGHSQLQQYANLPKGESEIELLNNEDYYQLINGGQVQQTVKLSGARVQTKPVQQIKLQQQQQQAQQAQPQQKHKYYDNLNAQQQYTQSKTPQHQQQYYHQKTKQAYPLAETTLEKEIAKLESSFQHSLQKHQPQHQPSGQNTNLRYKSPQYPTQKQSAPQAQGHTFTYNTPGLSQYASNKQTEELQYRPVSPTETILTDSQGHYSATTPKTKYLSEVHRFYNEPPQKLNQHNQIQYATTEKPEGGVHHQYQSYDRSNTMKVIPAPQLQYKSQKDQQNVYLKQHIIDEDSALQQQFPSEIIKGVLQNPAVPAKSAIYVSQSTGAPPHAKGGPKPQQHQQQQHHQHQQVLELDEAVKYIQPHESNTKQKQQTRPLTQEEFQALVDAGYSVTAIPVPVPVSHEEYEQHQKKIAQLQQKRPQHSQIKQSLYQQYQQEQQQQQSESLATYASDPSLYNNNRRISKN